MRSEGTVVALLNMGTTPCLLLGVQLVTLALREDFNAEFCTDDFSSPTWHAPLFPDAEEYPYPYDSYVRMVGPSFEHGRRPVGTALDV